MSDRHSKNLSKLTIKNYDTRLPTLPLSWSKLGRVQVIRNWSEEIKNLLENKASINEWNLVGHAIAIIHNDSDDCQKILQRVATDIGFNFTCLDEDSIEEAFVDHAILSSFNEPTLVYFEPGNWMKNVEDLDSQYLKVVTSIQENIIQMICDFDTKCPIIFCTSVEKYEDFSPKFRVQGLFDRRFLIINRTLIEIAENFLEDLGDEISGESLKIDKGKLGKLIDLEFNDKRRLGLITIRLKRLAKQEKRKIEFVDLVDLAMRGSIESDLYPEKSAEVLRYVAVHEAGHAAISILDSDGENIPEYASIIESEDFNGVVSDSFAYHYAKTDKKTYVDFRHNIRVSLAGRVAEHFVFGSEHVRLGSAKSDLIKATDLCYEMFSSRGISSSMETDNGASKNLLIDSELSDVGLTRIENITRDFLDEQYAVVYKLLTENIKLFETIAQKLFDNRLLCHHELKQVYESYK